MLVPGTWTWAETIPVLVVGIALLFLPGLVLALLLRTRIALACALAPALSTGMIAVGGMVFGALRVPWTTFAVVETVVASWVLAGAVRYVASRFRPPRLVEPTDAVNTAPEGHSPTTGRVAQTLGTLAGTAFAFASFA